MLAYYLPGFLAFRQVSQPLEAHFAQCWLAANANENPILARILHEPDARAIRVISTLFQWFGTPQGQAFINCKDSLYSTRWGSYKFHTFVIPEPTDEDIRHLSQVVAWLDTSEGSAFLANIVSQAHTLSAL